MERDFEDDAREPPRLEAGVLRVFFRVEADERGAGVRDAILSNVALNQNTSRALEPALHLKKGKPNARAMNRGYKV